MNFVKQALMTTVVVLVVIFVARKVPVIGPFVNQALMG
jgi:hypothetical protein